MTVAQRRESKFFLWQLPVSGSQNLHPNKFMPRILRIQSHLNTGLLTKPEYEDEQHEQAEEDSHVIHGPEHDDQRPLEVREEPDQLDDPQQSECSEDGEAEAALAVVVATEQLEPTEQKSSYQESLTSEHLPETDHKAVEHIESIIEIFQGSKSRELEHHFNGEDAAEEKIADLQYLGQEVGLVVVLQGQTDGVQQDADLAVH